MKQKSFQLYKIVAAVFVAMLVSTAGMTEEVSDGQDLLKKLKKASTKAGIQIGFVFDAQKEGQKPKYELITLKASKNASAFDALEKSEVQKEYYPQYSRPPMVMIKSLMGLEPAKGLDGKRQSWAIFIGSLDQASWKPSNAGIGGINARDGALVGFSRTPWAQKAGAFRPLQEPRIEWKEAQGVD